MHKEALEQYELDQKAKVLSSLPKGIKAGVLTDVKKLYPDVRLAQTHALARKGAPLNLLCFLYPQTCVFVPPESASRLRTRFGLDLDTLVELSRKRIIIPLIGHPSDYANRPHLNSILELEPPAVWPRGLALLESLRKEDLFDEAAKRLPLKQMASLPSVKQKWRMHHSRYSAAQLRRKIEEELMTNYIDLIVFGHREIAERIVATSDPNAVATLLLLTNEILTYPLLFGIGGTPNYPASYDGQIVGSQLVTPLAKKLAVIPGDLEILLKGLRIEITGNIDADTISDFHKHGLSKHLWKAIGSFERVAGRARRLDDTFDSAEYLQKRVKEAIRDVQDSLFERKRQNVRNRIKWYFRAGGASIGFAVGTWFAPLQVAATIGGGLPWILENITHIRLLEEWLTDLAMSEEYSPGVAHLWHLKSWSDRNRK